MIYVNEFKYITNTIGIGELLLKFGIFIALVVVLILFTLIRRIDTLHEKFMLTIGCLIIGAMLTPMLASFTNRLFGDSNTEWKSFELVDISARSEQMFGVIDSTQVHVDGVRVLVEGDEEQHSFYVKNEASIRRSDRLISLPLRRGAWGHSYLYEKQK